MKRYTWFTLACGLLALTQTACEDAANDAIDNLLYINEASTSKMEEISLQKGTDTRTSVTVRLAQATDHDVTAELFMDKNILESYNKKNETNYQMPLDGTVSFPEKITIAAGSVSAEPVNIDIASFTPEGGAQYAIPLAVKSVTGVDKSEASSHYLLALVTPLEQQVPKFNYTNAMQAAPAEEWNMVMPNYTLEWWCKMSGFSVNNQAIFNSGSESSELYIRFGDLVYGNNFKYLQIKTMGGQMDTGDPNEVPLEANVWYHFALSFDAASGVSTLYQNGNVVGTVNSGAGTPMKIDKLQMISSGAAYFRDNCELCQVRLWKTTRTANQIKKNMYKEVDYSNKDLVLYLPMNEGNGTTLNDVTGNGHDVVIGNMPGNGSSSSVSWSSYTFAK